jgi:hypothetical protein
VFPSNFDVGAQEYFLVQLWLHPVDNYRDHWEEEIALSARALLKAEFQERGLPSSDWKIVGILPYERGGMLVTALIGGQSLTEFDIDTYKGRTERSPEWIAEYSKVFRRPAFHGNGKFSLESRSR